MGDGESYQASSTRELRAYTTVAPLLWRYRHDSRFRQARQIAIDIDSTIYPLLAVMQALDGQRSIDPHLCQRWEDLPGLCGGVEPMLRLVEQAQSYPAAGAAGMIEGALMGLQHLIDHRVQLHMMTTREPDRLVDTTRWLYQHGITVTSLTCDLDSDKIALCCEYGIETIIDDHPATLARAAAEGIRGLSLRYPYNAQSLQTLGLAGADAWKELDALALLSVEKSVRDQLEKLEDANVYSAV